MPSAPLRSLRTCRAYRSAAPNSSRTRCRVSSRRWRGSSSLSSRTPAKRQRPTPAPIRCIRLPRWCWAACRSSADRGALLARSSGHSCSARSATCFSCSTSNPCGSRCFRESCCQQPSVSARPGYCACATDSICMAEAPSRRDQNGRAPGGSAASTRHPIDPAIAWAFGCIVLVLLVGSLYSSSFLSPQYLLQQLKVASFLGVIATGMMIVILLGQIDLSVPWVVAAGGMMAPAAPGGGAGGGSFGVGGRASLRLCKQGGPGDGGSVLAACDRRRGARGHLDPRRTRQLPRHSGGGHFGPAVAVPFF